MNKRSTVLSFFLLFFSAISVQSAQTSQQNTDYYVAIKGGISLGSYEAGLNWVMLQQLHQQQNDNVKLRSFSGASAGSLNGLLSAISHCSRTAHNTSTLFDNIMQKSWDLGTPDLLKVNKEEESGLFSRQLMKKTLIASIGEFSAIKATNNCDFVITMSVTQMKPYEHLLASSNETINLQRFVVPIQVTANVGQSIRFSNIAIDKIGNENQINNLIPGPYLSLMENEHGELTFDNIVKLAFASSAFPVAFEPMSLDYCFSNQLKGERCAESNKHTALFSDGGLFDNSPIGVARFIAQKNLEKRTATVDTSNKFLFINPDHYRPHQEESIACCQSDDKNCKSSEVCKNKAGLWQYASYLASSFNTATGEEYKQSLLDFEKEENQTLVISNRYHNLLADFHAHFGAFYSSDFRKHDYIVGVYDGLHMLAKLYYPEQSQLTPRLHWLKNWLKQLANQSQEPSDDIEFLYYLYNTEFSKEPNVMLLPISEPYQNINIVLNKAFKQPSIVKYKKQNHSFASYLDKLRKIIYINGWPTTYDEQTRLLVNDSSQWSADNISKVFYNIKNMQYQAVNADPDDKANAAIGNFLSFSQPFLSSYFYYMENKTWPLAYRPFWNHRYLNRWSVSSRYGFDISEKAQKFVVANRVHLTNNWSLDVDATYNVFGSELSNDNYWDVAIGPTYHFNSMVFNTVSIGYERAEKGREIYKDQLNSAYVKVSAIDQIVTLKLAARLNDLNENYQIDTREEVTFSVQFDLTKLFKIL